MAFNPDTYNFISADFDRTRYSIWKGVSKFLDDIPENSLCADIGCGNGKNMLYRKDLRFKGIDISDNLIKVCNDKKLDVIKGSVLDIPFNDNTFDSVICIAVIHHLETIEKRKEAIEELLRITKKGGNILIYVWALEQPEHSKRKFDRQEVMVPFITKKDGKCYERFYHVFIKDELKKLVKSIDKYRFEITDYFYELGNWVIVLTKI